MPHGNADTGFVFLTRHEIDEFLKRWRSLAGLLRDELDERGAAIIERRACELENWVATKGNESVSVADASDATGYSPDHLRRQLSSGELQNAGERGKLRVRRADLRPKGGQRLARAKAETYDPIADVRALREIRRGA
jgi:hypothetical protein